MTAPCPFCGGTDAQEVIDGPWMRHFTCMSCCARGPSIEACAGQLSREELRELALAAWNGRVEAEQHGPSPKGNP